MFGHLLSRIFENLGREYLRVSIIDVHLNFTPIRRKLSY